MKKNGAVFAIAFFACGFVHSAEKPAGEYLEGMTSKSAVILAHGQGQDPNSHVVRHLRKAVNKELGMHTLSLQMPLVSGAPGVNHFQQYLDTFPDAYKRIQNGIDFLKSKNVEKIYLMGYSMGARMTTAFLAEHPDSEIQGYIGVGMLGGGDGALNTNRNIRKVKVPVLDIYAEGDRDAQAAEFRRNLVSNRYQQIGIPGAKHDYMCCEMDVSALVIRWLNEKENEK